MRLRHSNRQRPWLSGPISALPDLPGTAELRRFDNAKSLCSFAVRRQRCTLAAAVAVGSSRRL
jgi:hypothetical protein